MLLNLIEWIGFVKRGHSSGLAQPPSQLQAFPDRTDGPEQNQIETPSAITSVEVGASGQVFRSLVHDTTVA